MGNLKFFESIVNKKMLDLHTAFLGKVISVSGDSAKVQPLGMTKEIGGAAKPFAPVSSVPITQQARYKLKVSGEAVVSASPIESGDVVICVCCDRDITAAKQGKSVLPPAGHHTMSDCVIVGIL